MGVQQDKTVDVLLQARVAYERGDWVLAFNNLRGAADLGPKDSMALATSAYLLGNVDDAVRALQAGYQDRIRSGDSLGAVRFAFWLGLVLNLRGEMAVGGGWIARAQRLLESESEDVVERGYLLIHEFYQHLVRGDFARAGETAARVVEVGRRFTDHNLIAQGLVSQGRLLIYSGRVPEGLALLDEAMVEISICGGLADYRRDGLLRNDRGVPGVVRFLSRGLLDHGPDQMVRRAARAGSLYRAMLAAPGTDHAAPWGI